MTQNFDAYIPIVILMVLGVLMVGGALIVGSFIRPKNPNKVKLQPYECGEDPTGSAWANFNVRFYVVALIFIIFDVERAISGRICSLSLLLLVGVTHLFLVGVTLSSSLPLLLLVLMWLYNTFIAAIA